VTRNRLGLRCWRKCATRCPESPAKRARRWRKCATPADSLTVGRASGLIPATLRAIPTRYRPGSAANPRRDRSHEAFHLASLKHHEHLEKVSVSR
jgi:hypothetical protein